MAKNQDWINWKKNLEFSWADMGKLWLELEKRLMPDTRNFPNLTSKMKSINNLKNRKI